MFSEEKLNKIFDKTDGRCRFCGKQLSWSNYGQRGRRGAWAVDHSIPPANGGSDHLNNLYATCYACNEEKSNTRGSSYKAKLRRQGRHVARRGWWSGEYR